MKRPLGFLFVGLIFAAFSAGIVLGVTQTVVPNVQLFLGTSDVVAEEVVVTGWDINTLSGTDIVTIDVTVQNTDCCVSHNGGGLSVTITDSGGAHTVSAVLPGILAGGSATLTALVLDTPADLITLTAVDFTITSGS